MSEIIFGIKLKKEEPHKLEAMLDDLFPDWKEQTLYIWGNNEFESSLDINKLYDLSKFQKKELDTYHVCYYNESGFICSNSYLHGNIVTNIKPKSKFLWKETHEIKLVDIWMSIFSLPDEKKRI